MAEPFRPISHFAVNILARIAARKEVIAELKAEGIRVSLVKPVTINLKTTEYLATHPELYAEAHEKAQRLGMFEKPKRRSNSRQGRH